ncbi:MAG: Ig domain-containing protein [Bacteroidales bacterium]|nr:Ig domain-containing protein [Bacteroidales bacterium]
MKRFIILISAALCLLNSCNGKFEESYDSLKLDMSEYELLLEGGRFMVYVYYNGSWTMELPSDVTWARIEEGSGTGIGYAYVVYDMGIPEDRSAVVTVTADNGETATFTISQGMRVIPSVSITLDQTEVSMVHDDPQLVLKATVLPEDTTYPEVEWKSSDESVATVDNQGRITVTGAGQVTITASNGGHEATCTITISAPLRGIALNATTLSMFEGGLYMLMPVYDPVFAENKDVTWCSSDEAVATVDGGLVKALKLGDAVIKVTSAEGGFEAECMVTVQESVIIDVPDFGGDGEGFKDDDYIWEN